MERPRRSNAKMNPGSIKRYSTTKGRAGRDRRIPESALMYSKGLVEVTVPPCAEMLADPGGECYNDDHEHQIRDANGRDENPVGTAFLPHSCDAWVIGGKEEIQQLVDDLLQVLATMR